VKCFKTPSRVAYHDGSFVFGRLYSELVQVRMSLSCRPFTSSVFQEGICRAEAGSLLEVMDACVCYSFLYNFAIVRSFQP